MSEVEVELCPVLSSTPPASFQRTLLLATRFFVFFSDLSPKRRAKLPRLRSPRSAPIYRRMADWAASGRLPPHVAQTPTSISESCLWLPEAGEDFALLRTTSPRSLWRIVCSRGKLEPSDDLEKLTRQNPIPPPYPPTKEGKGGV